MAKRALLVGINKYKDAPLDGCVNDVTDMAEMLTRDHGFKAEDIRLLVDKRATTAAIKERLKWLVDNTKSKDRVVFHFSGHGVQMPSRNDRGEVDSLDEAICPYDFDWSERRVIRDNTFSEIFSKLSDGVDFLWVSDSCHSGGLSRDGFRKSFKGHARKVRSMPVPADIQWRLRTAREKGITAKGVFKEDARSIDRLLMLSGCRSHQTSADAWFNERPNGALTYHLLQALKEHKGKTMTELLEIVRTTLHDAEFDQIPQMMGNIKMQHRPLFG